VIVAAIIPQKAKPPAVSPPGALKSTPSGVDDLDDQK